MWTLLLILWTGDGATSSTIPGFVTEQSCIMEANKIELRMEANDKWRRSYGMNITCVEVKHE